MKVLFITQDDPIYVRQFFEELLSMDIPDLTISIVMAPPMGKKTIKELISQMWDFYGPIDFVRMGIRFAVSKVGGRLPRWLRMGRNFTIKQVAATRGLEVQYVQDLNDDRFVESVKKEQVDILVSVAAPQKLCLPLIQAAAIGSINIHNGTLPQYRGMLPNFWQMYDGAGILGTTIHRINKALDDGPILARMTTELRSSESLDSVIKRTKRNGAAFVLDVLNQLRDGTYTEYPNDKSLANYRGFPTRQDVAEFRRRGYKLL